MNLMLWTITMKGIDYLEEKLDLVCLLELIDLLELYRVDRMRGREWELEERKERGLEGQS